MGAAAFLRETIDRCLLELCEWEKALKEGEFEFYRFELDGNALGLLLLTGDYGLSSSSKYIAGYLQDGNELRTNFSEELSEDKIKFAVDEFGGLRVVGACWRVLSSVITKPGQFAANRLRSAAMDRVELASRASSLPGSGGPAAKRPRVS